jgi:uncharacterized membrane protein
LSSVNRTAVEPINVAERLIEEFMNETALVNKTTTVFHTGTMSYVILFHELKNSAKTRVE